MGEGVLVGVKRLPRQEGIQCRAFCSDEGLEMLLVMMVRSKIRGGRFQGDDVHTEKGEGCCMYLHELCLFIFFR